jgi:ketosteroid isomerase-like protein
MSEEAAEVVREHIEAYRNDDVPGALALLDPDVIVDTGGIGGADGVVTAHGHEGVVREVRRWMGAFEDFTFEVERVTDLGGGTVVVAVTERGRGKGSGVLVERSVAALYNVLGGKIVRITGFRTEREALEAAGLSE